MHIVRLEQYAVCGGQSFLDHYICGAAVVKVWCLDQQYHHHLEFVINVHSQAPTQAF